MSPVRNLTKNEMNYKYIFTLLLIFTINAQILYADSKVLTFGKAVDLALGKNPRLIAFKKQIKASDGLILQAGLLPNPEIGAEFENILGNKEFQGFDVAETTLFISQRLERRGKRLARKTVAEKNKSLLFSNYKVLEREILGDVANAYVEVLAVQEAIRVFRKFVDLNKSFLAPIQKRIDAGKVTDAQRTRAETAISSAELELLQMQSSLEIAKLQLVSTWGETLPTFSRVSGSIAKLPKISDLESLKAKIISHPELKRYDALYRANEAKLHHEKLKRKQDLTLNTGVRQFRGNDDAVAFVVGFSIPLPFWNRNQGNITAAEAQLEATRAQKYATSSLLVVKFLRAYQQHSLNKQALQSLQNKIIPQAQQNYKQIFAGYEQGRFSYLEVIEARKSLALSERQLLNYQKNIHQAAAEIAILTNNLNLTFN